jgi:hypothetical protein
MSTKHKTAEGNESLLVERSFDEAFPPIQTTATCYGNTEETAAAKREIPPRADEFSDEKLVEFGKKFQLICLLEAGHAKPWNI